MEKIERFYNISPKAVEVPNSDVKKLGATQYLTCGNDNKFPNGLMDLMKNVSVLRALVEGCSNIASGLFTMSDGAFDWSGLFMNLYLYGWCPVLVRRSFDHKHLHLTPLDARYVRTNEDRSMFAYSEQPGWRDKIEYPAYSEDVDGTSIYYIGINDLESPYALPIWSSSLKEVSILKKVADYHNNSLDNGFFGQFLLNFNNGMPDAESKREIEQLVNDKFCGTDNAGRCVISFNDSKENEASLQSLPTEDTSARYKDLIDSCRQSLYASFRCSSQLFGCPDGSETALTATEYSYKFGLFVQFNLIPICGRVFEAMKRFGAVMEDPWSLVRNLVWNSEKSE